MLQVSSYSPNYSNVNYGSKALNSKKVSAIAPKVTPTTKKAIGLGAILAGLFGAKKAAVTSEVKTTPSRFQYREEKIYDKNGRLTNILKYSNADDFLSINIEYDTRTGNVKKKDWMRKDGITELYTEKYDVNGNKKNSYWYYNNSQIRWMEEYGKRQDLPKEVTWYDRQGRITEQVQLDDATGKLHNRFKFDEDGNLSERSEVSGLTGKIIKTTNYHPNGGKTVQEFNIISGKPENKFQYDKNGRLVNWTTTDDSYNRKIYYRSHIKPKEDDYDLEFDKKQKTNELSQKDLDNISKFLGERYEMEHAE